MHRFPTTCAALLATLGACLLAGAPAAGAATGTARVGAPAPLPPGAAATGTAPAGEQLRLRVALQPQDPAALERFAAEVSTPGSPAFRDYVSVPEFARRFGAAEAQIAAVRAALRSRGLEVGPAAANDLSLPVTTTVAGAEAAFGITIQRVRTGSGRLAHRNDRAPAFPAGVAPYVQGVTGLDDVSLSHRHDGEPAASPLFGAARTSPTADAVATGGPQPCEAATQVGEEWNGYTADQIAAAYRLSGFYEAGNFGAGQTIALLEQEPYLPSDIATYQSCYGTHATVTDVDVEGGPGPFKGEDGEAALDIEQLIGLAPEAHIVVYQGPNPSEPEVLAAFVEQNVAKVMSSSWGDCEEYTEPAEMAAMDTLLQEAAAQGQSFFVAAGDDGSTDCYGSDHENKSVSVDTPGSQPFATDVGGTRVTDPTAPPTEYIWSDNPLEGGGGGGVSAHFPMPAYQAEAAPALGVVSGLSSGAPCGFSGYCRQVPDVSANADPDTGYVVFTSSNEENEAEEVVSTSAWGTIGGTSAATPLWAAFATLANASPACHGTPIGFANPALYEVAGSSYATDFHDITSGRPGGYQTTDIFAGTGPYPAAPGYDMASGLGSPVGPELAASLCGVAPSPPPPAPGPAPQAPAGGPAGPATAAPAPRLRHAALSVTRRRARIRFALAARAGASLRTLALTLPAGLGVSRSPRELARGVRVANPRHGRLAARIRTYARTIVIRLRRPVHRAILRVSTPALRVSPRLAAWLQLHPTRRLRVVVVSGETGHRHVRYTLALRP